MIHPLIGDNGKKYTQKANEKILWYARGVHGTILTTLSTLAAQQSKPTNEKVKIVKQFLDYTATQEPVVLTYQKSGMVLAVHSNAGGFNEANT